MPAPTPAPNAENIDQMSPSEYRNLWKGIFRVAMRISTVVDFFKQAALTFMALKLFNFMKAFLFALYELIPLATRQAIARAAMVSVGMLPAVVRATALKVAMAIAGVIPVFVVRIASFFANLAPVLLAVGLIRYFIIKPWFQGHDEVAGATASTAATVFTDPSLLANDFGLSIIAAAGSTLVAAGRYFFGGTYDAMITNVMQSLDVYCHEHQAEKPAIGTAINAALAGTENTPQFNVYYVLLSKNAAGQYQASIHPQTTATDKLYNPQERAVNTGTRPVIDPSNGNTVIAVSASSIGMLRMQWMGIGAVFNLPQPTLQVQHTLTLPAHQIHANAHPGFPGAGQDAGATVAMIPDAPVMGGPALG